MRKLLPVSLIVLIIMVIAMPAAGVRSCRPVDTPPPPSVDRTPIESPAGEIMLDIFNHNLGQLQTMSLEEYLVGVVTAEMPAAFDLEALKAQAVVARTYTVNQMRAYGGKGCDKHSQADICTDPAHCQAWESEEKALGKWPAQEASTYLNKIRAAVRATAGKVVLHNGNLIDAVFHASCGGHTENSENVWSAALPYLRGVADPYCIGTRWSKTEHEFSGAQFAQAIFPYVSAVPVSSSGRPLLDNAVRSNTGRIKQLNIAGETVSGRDLRSALKLPSTNVTWQITGEKVTFTVRGYGHGVGLCQYGANGMANAGKDYLEIIQHYYTDVEVKYLTP